MNQRFRDYEEKARKIQEEPRSQEGLVCRHCGREIEVTPSRQDVGFIDECQEGPCWAKRNPAPPTPTKSVYKPVFEKREKANTQFRKAESLFSEWVARKKTSEPHQDAPKE
jgi:hypothetical protein